MLRHPCILGTPNKGEQNQKWLPHPCLLGGPHGAGSATSPLHSQGSPTPSAVSKKLRRGPQQRGTKSEVAASALSSRGHKQGRKCYVTPACSGSPTKGEKISSGCLTPAFSGAQKRAEMLRHACILGIPNKGKQNQKWLPHPYLLGGTKRAGNATSPLHSWDPQQRGTKSEVAASPLPSRGPTWGRKCYVTLAFSRIPNAKRGEQKTQKGSPTKGNKIRSGCVSPIFSGAQTGQEMLRHPCMLGIPKKGEKISSGCLTPAFSGAQKRAQKLRHVCILGIPNKGEQNQKWLPHPYLLGGTKRAGNATSPLHSWDPQQRGTKSEVAASPLPSRGPTWGRKCYVTLAFSRIPNAKRGEQKTQKGSPTKGNKIRSGCVSPIFSGAQTGQEMLRHPCMLGIPNKGGKNQQWLPHPCLLGGPKEGAKATSRLHSRDPQQRGTKSEVAASSLSSRGHKKGRKCYVTPAFLGPPTKGNKIKSGCLTPAFSGAHMGPEVLRHPCILKDPQRQAR